MPIDTLLAELDRLRRKPDGTAYTPDLAKLARQYGKNHGLALDLWATGDHTARSLAILIADPSKIGEKLVDSWVEDLDEWGLCDSFTATIVRPSPFAVSRPFLWAERDELYVRRAGFSLIAQMAWQTNGFADELFISFLPLVEKHAADDRLHVKKAVNWALRDIGKRNAVLARYALLSAGRLRKLPDRTARWVGSHRISEIKGS